MRSAIAVTVLGVLGVLTMGASRVFSPFDSGHYEGGLWAPAQLLLQGRNPYDMALTDRPPFVMAPYGPVFYAILGVGLEWFGVGFWWGRAVSLGALLGCAVLVARLAMHFTQQRELAWLGAGLFLSQLPVLYWAGLQRPDSVALLCSLGALALAFPSSDTLSPAMPRTARVCAVAVLGVLAFFCRRTAFLPLLIIAFGFVQHKNGRAASIFVGMCAAIIIATFVWLNASSDGGFWWQQWALSSSVSKTLTLALESLAMLFLLPVTLMLLWLSALGTRMALQRARSTENSLYRLWGVYLALSCLLAFITSSRDGANLNYWLEPAAVAAVFGVWTLHRLPFDARLPRACRLCVGLSVVIGTLVLGREERKRWQAAPQFHAIIAALRQHPDPRPVFTFLPELAVAAQKPYWFNDAWQYDGRSPRHRRAWRAALQRRDFSALINFEPNSPPGYQRHSTPFDHLYPIFLHLSERNPRPRASP